MLQTARSLVDQVYDAIVDDICGGRLEAGTHLVQERLAERFGISRQPIQHAMARLKGGPRKTRSCGEKSQSRGRRCPKPPRKPARPAAWRRWSGSTANSTH
jgi:DNA-binding transcriptional MocR family regulator